MHAMSGVLLVGPFSDCRTLPSAENIKIPLPNPSRDAFKQGGVGGQRRYCVIIDDGGHHGLIELLGVMIS